MQTGQEFECLRCGHEWISKPRRGGSLSPAVCPKCHTYLWDREKVNKSTKTKKRK